MNWKSNWKKWKIAMGVGILAAFLFMSHENPTILMKAWWGTLYPEYCYSQVPDTEDGEEVQIRIKFRWLHGI